MNFARTFAAATLALATFGLAGCGGGIEGKYSLDKAEVKKSAEAEITKLPADQQGFAKLAIAMIDAMEMSLELEAGGKLKTKTTMPSFDKGKPAKTEEKAGTWKMDGEAVVLDNGDGKPLKCSKSGSKLNCAGQKKGEPTLVFAKG